MGDALPKIKKRVNAFLVGEEGKISKSSLIKAGAFLGAVAVSSAALSNPASATHTNSINGAFDIGNFRLTGSHTHHASHASHGSHGSHCSHMC